MKERHYAALDAYLTEAQAGVPDQWLHEKTLVPLAVIERWRKSRDLKRPRNHAVQEQLWALQGLASDYNSALHTVGSGLGGKWEPPAFLLRVPIDYSKLCRMLHFLNFELGTGAEALAEAFGLREQDVATALQTYQAYLLRRGTGCAGCNATVDPANGEYCSRRCRDAQSL